MATTTTTTLGTSNLRTSSRQTRTNPTRTSKTVGSTLRQNSLISSAPLAAVTTNEPHGFYPAITHFTDAITALPREFRRHASLLKEVDAKAWAPEENLQALLIACDASKPPRPAPGKLPSAAASTSSTFENNAQQKASEILAGSVADNASQTSTTSLTDPATLRRRRLFYDLRYNLTEMMVTMDEKNHVINNANEEMSRHLRRLDAVYPYIASEVSEEARLGSLTHWAYLESRAAAKGAAQPSSRRDAAASLASMHDTDIASRSEARREALLARKQRQNQVDSDFDDTRVASKRANGNGRLKRIGEIAAESNLALGISNPAPAAKRRKPEKPASGGVAMERSLSGALTGGRAMSREPSQQEATAKKRKAPASGATAAARKRINVNVSATNSPNLVSSPLAATFGKDNFRASPVPPAVRPQSIRARQNSTQNHESSRTRPVSSASTKNNTNGHVIAASTPENQNGAAGIGKSATESKNAPKDLNNKTDRSPKNDTIPQSNGTPGEAASIRGGALLERTTSRSGNTKREPDTSEENLAKTAAKQSPRLPPPLLATENLRSERPIRGRVSKTSTPVASTFAESADVPEPVIASNGNTSKPRRPPQPRSSRMKDALHDSLSPTGLPMKRSHKKGAGLAAQAAALQAKLAARDTPATAAEEETAGSSVAASDEDEEGVNGEGEEERYCYCQGISYGEMVACDAKDCPTEWFHLECVGLEKAPGKNTKWYCDECKERLNKKGRTGSAVGNGK